MKSRAEKNEGAGGHLEAGRANSGRVKPWLKSTGPKTAEGKAISRMDRYQGVKREAPRARALQIRAVLIKFRVLEQRGVTCRA